MILQLYSSRVPLFHHAVKLLFQFLVLLIKRHVRSTFRCGHPGLKNGNGSLRLLYLRFTIGNATFQFLELLIKLLLLLIREFWLPEGFETRFLHPTFSPDAAFTGSGRSGNEGDFCNSFRLSICSFAGNHKFLPDVPSPVRHQTRTL